MSTLERLETLEQENLKLREDNETLLKIIAQMKITLNRLVSRYISESTRA